MRSGWLRKLARERGFSPSGQRGSSVADERGFSLVELLVALTILLIASVAFVPLFVYVAEASDANQAKLVATNLTNSVVEQIRSLPYEGVGTVGGNPAGAIPHERTQTIEGRRYTIRTDIWWVNDPSDDDASGNDPIPYDYKRVKVTVTARGLFAGSVTTSQDIRTLVALEGEEEVFPGGNVLAQVFRGWRTTPGEEIPVEGVRIDLTGGPSALQTLWTDERGQALFAILQEGDYTVTADASPQGMMIHPLQVEQTATVSEAMTTQATFEAERPCHLALELRNKDTGALITSGGQVILVSPFAGELPRVFTADMKGTIPSSLLGDIWPVGAGYPGYAYGLKVLADGHLPYDLQTDPDRAWDGTFASPGETKTLTIDLVPATASVTVTSATTGAAVTGATVEISVHTWVYHPETGSWTDSCSAFPLQTALTEANGRASFRLPDNIPYEPLPGSDEYTRYCVKVSASGYLDFGPEHGAFWVSGGQQMREAGAIATYGVSLQPEFRRIRVRTERLDGNPRNDVRIRVV
ncbi:MAG TPA: type II secretion system protein, partial [Firmicutes bacterium]|nr:type II secretion system protein [Bacillota bacterium]